MAKVSELEFLRDRCETQGYLFAEIADLLYNAGRPLTELEHMVYNLIASNFQHEMDQLALRVVMVKRMKAALT